MFLFREKEIQRDKAQNSEHLCFALFLNMYLNFNDIIAYDFFEVIDFLINILNKTF